MPSLATLIASCLSGTIAVPLLAFAQLGGGAGCQPSAVVSNSVLAASPSGISAGTQSASSWDNEQLGIAATIIDVGRAKGVPPWGWVVAVATAMQESRLRNLPGGDADSIGVFQQRPSEGWGTPTQLASPTYQSGRFYDALLTVPDWQRLPLEQASQAVPRSAHPSAYANWITPATLLVEQITTGRSGSPGASALCPDGRQVLARAATWLTGWNGGPVPYSMSTDPAVWFGGYRRDCSGYASMALGLPGPGLTAGGLAARSTPISKTALQPGDLLINPTSGGAGHVVIFDHWTDATMNTYMAYEQSGDGGTHHHVIPYPYFGGYPMSPYRNGN
jgi:hypothetical protein